MNFELQSKRIAAVLPCMATVLTLVLPQQELRICPM